MEARPRPSLLEPSELGTREYWDQFYAKDLDNTQSRTSPPFRPRRSSLTSIPSQSSEESEALTGWFADVRASEKVLQYTLQLASPSSPIAGVALDTEETSFLDLGTGNGEMLFLLREKGNFKGSMLGVDYSQASIELCQSLAVKRDFGNNAPKIHWALWDIMSTSRLPNVPCQESGWDVILDKGTFDAISLSGDQDEQGQRVCESGHYANRVKERLSEKGGLLLITSCNWTESELKDWICRSNAADPNDPDCLEPVGRIEYPAFKFGGQTGQSVCTVCFQRRRRINHLSL